MTLRKHEPVHRDLKYRRWVQDVFPVTELKTVLASMGEKLSDKEVGDMLHEADSNGDGVIDFSGWYRTTHSL